MLERVWIGKRKWNETRKREREGHRTKKKRQNLKYPFGSID